MISDILPLRDFFRRNLTRLFFDEITSVSFYVEIQCDKTWIKERVFSLTWLPWERKIFKHSFFGNIPLQSRKVRGLVQSFSWQEIHGLLKVLLQYASRTLAMHRNIQSLALFLWLQKTRWRQKKGQTLTHIWSTFGAVWRIIRAIMAI